MPIKREQSEYMDEAIVVMADLDTLRKAVAKALFEYDEVLETLTLERKKSFDTVEIGETIIFKERMDLMPAEIVAVKIGEQQWLVISTTELPDTGFPTTQDAMRVVASEAKKLKLIKDFLAKEAGNYVVQDIQSWEPDKLADAEKIRAIISEAEKKWQH